MIAKTEQEAEKRENDDQELGLKQYFRFVNSIPLLTATEEIELAQKIAQGDEQAFQEMVEANLRLVRGIARSCERFAGSNLTLADLIQEGAIGLMKAARRFDWRRGNKFSTYANYWIKQGIFRAIAQQGRIIHLPIHHLENISRFKKVAAVLSASLGRDATVEEVAADLGISIEETKELSGHIENENIVSLETPVGNEGDSCLSDILPDRQELSPVEHIERKALREEIEQALQDLSNREQEILRLRFGWDDSNPRTLDEVGAHFHLTRERIRQIEKRALRKLRSCPSLRLAAEGLINHHKPRRRRRHRHTLNTTRLSLTSS